MTRVGVLALQGGFAAHVEALRRLGVDATEVRRASELDELDALVLPGGESTTLLRLMHAVPGEGDEAGGVLVEPWFRSLRELHARGGAFLATCAGAILLAREVRSPSQPSVGLLDATIERNAYGRQIDSFETELAVTGADRPVPAVFIRAPRFVELGHAVEVLACLDGEPVLVRQGKVLAATFHPELTEEAWLHRRLLGLVVQRREAVSC